MGRRESASISHNPAQSGSKSLNSCIDSVNFDFKVKQNHVGEILGLHANKDINSAD